MGYDVWKTLFTRDFNCDKYIYHYTSVENAIQIIQSNQMVFSGLSASNDFLEEKVRIAYIDKANNKNIEDCPEAKAFNCFLQKRSKLLQLLCFCVDTKFPPAKLKKMAFIHTNHNIDKYFDITGRGFASPYMWSKYQHKNAVCFILNKAAFEKYLNADADFWVAKQVRYLGPSSYFEIDSEKLTDLHSKMCLFSKKRISLSRKIIKIPEYIDFNFFFKDISFQGECEYRYVAMANCAEDTVCVTQLDKYIEGIVCSEDIDSEVERDLIALLNNSCDIKKISFRDSFYRLLEK